MSDKPIVLVVDDTPVNIDLLKLILSDKYQVKVALNGTKAIEIANTEPQPDIILLDIIMPGISGYEVCSYLKAESATKSIPVIFITAKTEVADEQKGLQLGAVDYITKPFHQDIVLARLETHIAIHHRTMILHAENKKLTDSNKPQFVDFSRQNLLPLIKSGEGSQLEFKSTLRWNLHSDKTDKKIENSCLKTVSGYLNSQGGVLIIGVADDGQVLGLNQDHFKSEDKMLLHWVNLLKSCLGAEFMQWIQTTIHSINHERIIIVDCLPAANPVFMIRDNEETFYTRMGNSTQALSTREVIAYIAQRFPSKE